MNTLDKNKLEVISEISSSNLKYKVICGNKHPYLISAITELVRFGVIKLKVVCITKPKAAHKLFENRYSLTTKGELISTLICSTMNTIILRTK